MGIRVGTTVRGRDVTWGGYRTGVVKREVRTTEGDANALFAIEAEDGRTYVVECASEVVNDSVQMRRRVTHGWAFRSLPEESQKKVKLYISTGDPEHLEGTGYAPIREGLYKRGER